MTYYTLQPTSASQPKQENIQQLVRAGAGPAVILNTDIQNPITIAHSLGPQIPDLLNLENVQTSTIGPNNSVTVTGEDDVWGINFASAPVTVDVHTNSLYNQLSPFVANADSGDAILQGPGTTTMYTFTAQGRIWSANVSYSMGSSGGTGSNQGYARVKLSGGRTLAICECVVVSNPDSNSNDDSSTFPGLLVPSGTIVSLDVNGGTTITGVVQRGSGVVVVSVP